MKVKTYNNSKISNCTKNGFKQGTLIIFQKVLHFSILRYYFHA